MKLCEIHKKGTENPRVGSSILSLGTTKKPAAKSCGFFVFHHLSDLIHGRPPRFFLIITT
jgi:hypothetical protein